MTYSKLHKLDQQLCDYIRSNILYRSDEEHFMSVLQAEMDSDLLDYLLNEDDELENQQSLINSDELYDLFSAVNDMTDRFVLTWSSYEHLHRRTVFSVAEVRENLSPTNADQWAALCRDFSSQLEQDDLPMVEGIEIVTDWLYELRRLLSAIGRIDLIPAPQGTFPSATDALPRETPSSSETDLNQSPKHSDIGSKEQSQNRLENKPSLTPPEVAKLLGVNPDKIRNWIRSGDLKAINIAKSLSGRPRYVVDRDELERFKAKRSVQKPLPSTVRKQKQSSDVIEFF